MGAQEDALWQIDSEENGMEKAYCCFATNAKDFARMGKLYKDHGKWNGIQLLDSAFIAKAHGLVLTIVQNMVMAGGL